MTVVRRYALAVAALLLVSSASLHAAPVLTPGDLYALVYDFSVSKEKVVTVDPESGALTTIGSSSGITDCCLIGGFPVYALDANTGGFYAAGFHQSDSDSSDIRLLGFDATTGTLESDPQLTSGTYNNNLFKLDTGTGILWGLLYDIGAGEEQVAIVTPTTADRTQIGTTIANCCSIGGFNVSAFDPATGRLYVAGNLTGDGPEAPKRLLGFDVLTGTLVSNPYLSTGWQYNDFELNPLTGTLYGIVHDFATNKEYVVTVDKATAAVTPVGDGIADCCTVSSFNAFNPHAGDAGRLYIMGNLLSDPGSSLPRLLGFDVATGTLATSPFLPTGWNFNVLQAAVGGATNLPPVALCQNVTVTAAPGQCGADASIDAGSYDPEGFPVLTSQDPGGPYLAGDTDVTLNVFDGEESSSCTATVTVIDNNSHPPPLLFCNSPETMEPPDEPVSFNSTASGICSESTATITGYDCWKMGDDGPHHASCQVEIDGGTITINHTGGVGTHIEWTVESEGATLQCSIEIVRHDNGN